MNIGELTASLGIDTKDLKTANRHFKSFERTANKSLKSITRNAKRLAIAGLAAVTAELVFATKATADFQKRTAQMDAVLRSTRQAAGLTRKEILALADSLQELTTFSNGAVLGAENLLLTFTNIGKDVFPDAIKTVLDMSTALDQGLKESAIQVGKALNDPILGITALRRVGVNFSDAQKEVVKSLVETNKFAEAQTFILKELQTEFGGSAEAAGNTLPGQWKNFINTLNDTQRALGDVIRRTKFTSGVLRVLKSNVKGLGDDINANNKEMTTWIDDVARTAAQALTKAIGVVAGVKAILEELWRFMSTRVESIIRILKLDEVWKVIGEESRNAVKTILSLIPAEAKEGFETYRKLFVEKSEAAAFEAWVSMQEIFNANPLEFQVKMPEMPRAKGMPAAKGALDEFSVAQLQRMLANERLAGKERERIWKEVQARIKAGNVGMWESFTAGAMDATEQFGNSAQMMMDLGRNMANSLADNLTDAFHGMISGAKNFKEAFRDMALAFADDVIRMISRLLALQAVQAAMGLLFPAAGAAGAGAAAGAATPTVIPAANGGIFPGGIKEFAHGGTVRQPTVGLIGEGRYNEAVVPLPDGRSIPVDMRGDRNGGDIYEVTIIANDARSFADMVSRNPDSIVGVVSQSIRQRGKIFNDMRYAR
jgi:hypothetical protein